MATPIWAVAAIAGGLLWGWPALALTMKPTLAPLALIGAKRRSWWLAAAAGCGFVLLTLPMWSDYVVSVRNAILPIIYSVGSLPLLAVPLVAWMGRRVDPSRRMARDTPAH